MSALRLTSDDFDWTELAPHLLRLSFRGRIEEVAFVKWDDRHGWDAYCFLTHGCLGSGSCGKAPNAKEDAMAYAVSFVLRDPEVRRHIEARSGEGQDVAGRGRTVTEPPG